ncbi:RTA1 domain-containing protein [Aspergillus neoniger CBS 115656]|uniref:RTA1 domain protein n=1 Tax=Aspergillus neoniger (strain CBS 115656) TaxID=1448310 RepID=A0A318YZ23_ASPNB|nr:RTA1 domain protein [Aspergillus neoniger CBS 115656]PYH30152.1 RTA1 domain protein [Aspergillus neoniger CBS 115656]
MSSYELYRYTPSLAAAILFIALFIFITAYHAYQMAQARAWYFTCFVLGGIFQVIGYIARALAHNNTQSVPIYAMQAILILLAPPLYAAAIYMTLGRLITLLDAERLSLVPIRWLTAVFVTGDVLSFLLQGAGGGIMASGTLSGMTTGENVIMGGLAVQLIFFSVFVIIATLFHYRIHQNPTEKSMSTCIARSGWRNPNWETTMVGLYIASILILIRSVFRMIEYAGGNDGYLMSHEAFSYVFDAMLMFFAMIVISVLHPSKVLGSGKEVKVDKRESVQLQRLYSS